MSDLATALASKRLVDLTAPLGPDTVLWPGSTPFEATVVADHDTHGGYARELAVPEHAGTHLDAPAHFARDGSTTEQLPLDVLVRPAVKLDVRHLVDGDPRFTLTAADVQRLEAADGRIPRDSAVLVHTGWRADPAEPLAFPGLAADAAELLVARGAAGVGIDTIGVDPGHVTDFAAHRVTLPAGLWHLEGLVGLERVPARGAWIVAAVIPVVAGSGSPARVFAILPT